MRPPFLIRINYYIDRALIAFFIKPLEKPGEAYETLLQIIILNALF